MARALLIDIEGTTSAISFVHDVLFPYAARELPAFVRAHSDEADVQACLQAVASDGGKDPGDHEALIATLLDWIREDRKATPLKTLQGMIWRQGYATGAFRAHFYPDALTALRAWHAAGVQLNIYSSGSVEAQQLFFGHSEAGDLRPLIHGWFDTTSGPKRETASYVHICRRLALAPAQLLFLSDVPEELDAAAAAGLATTWVVREVEGRYRLDEARQGPHPVVATLNEVVP